MKVRNTIVIFLVSGFWHGANWTFIFWGFLNALYFMPLLLLGWNRTNIGTVAEDRMLPSMREFFQMAVTFAMAAFAWIFFRAASLADAFHYVAGIFNKSLFSKPAFLPKPLILLIGFFLVIEWIGRREQYALAKFALRWPRALRWTFYYGLIVVMLLYMGKEQEFIYFQF
jgi:D-alanyl-lipoteichoic acid acyltransferase DltB (MBOAT superfamily)